MKRFGISLLFVSLLLVQTHVAGFSIVEEIENSNLEENQGDERRLDNLSNWDWDEITNIASPRPSFDGYTMFSFNSIEGDASKYANLVVVDMEGNLVKSLPLKSKGPNPTYFPIKFINSTTVMLYYNGISLWNLDTNKITTFNISGHHDFEYNYRSNTIFSLSGEEATIDGNTDGYTTIVEYNLEGDKIWEMSTTEFIHPSQRNPYEPELVHGNSLFWDEEENALYFNARNLDTFYKIDYTSKTVVWSLGRFGDFEMHDIDGKPKTSLFYGAHAVEKVNDTTFILFDNDRNNLTNIDNHQSRIIEISIDEETMMANISYIASPGEEYTSPLFGDADRLPNGNRLGVFGTDGHYWDGVYLEDQINARIAEFNEKGELAWELHFPKVDEYRRQVYQATRYRHTPTLMGEVDRDLTSSSIELSWDAYYNFQNKRAFEGQYFLYLNEQLIDSSSFVYNLYWQATPLTMTIDSLAAGMNNVTLVITDEEGHQTSDTVMLQRTPFILNRSGIVDYEKGLSNKIEWTGSSIDPLQLDIFADTNKVDSLTWSGENVYLDLSEYSVGIHNITLTLSNASGLIYIDQFNVTIHDPDPPNVSIINYKQSIPRFTTFDFRWSTSDYAPKNYSIYLDGVLQTNGDIDQLYMEISYGIPDLEESQYNLTIVIYDQLTQKASSSILFSIVYPTNPIISGLPYSLEFRWGIDVTLSWQIYAAGRYEIMRDGVVLDANSISSNETLFFVIEDWQKNRWGLGIYNITLIAYNDDNHYSTDTVYLKIVYASGNPFAKAIVQNLSWEYSNGNNALGEPDGKNATLFFGYDFGRITVDIGEYNTIYDGLDFDFSILASGTYDIYVSPGLSLGFTYLNTYTGNAVIDLHDFQISEVRYVQIKLANEGEVHLDSVVAHNYNQQEIDNTAPQIVSPGNFELSDTDTSLKIIWGVSDLTPWNFSISIDGSVVLSDYWIGGDIEFQMDLVSKQETNVTLVVMDLFGNKASDMINIRFISSPTTSSDTYSHLPLVSLGIIVLLFKRYRGSLKTKEQSIIQ